MLASIFSFFTNKVGFLGCIVFPCLLLAGLVLQGCVNSIRNELACAREEMNRPKPKEPPVDPLDSMTAQEYEEMIARIRMELTKELMERTQALEGEHHVGILEEEQADTTK